MRGGFGDGDSAGVRLVILGDLRLSGGGRFRGSVGRGLNALLENAGARTNLRVRIVEMDTLLLLLFLALLPAQHHATQLFERLGTEIEIGLQLAEHRLELREIGVARLLDYVGRVEGGGDWVGERA